MTDIAETTTSKKFEISSAVTIALLAAVLGITDLLAGKYGDDEIIGGTTKANLYSWYQSKSVKQSLIEGQRDLTRTLIQSGAVQSSHIPALNKQVDQWNQEIDRYKKEKRELLEGSATVGKENWMQPLNGEFGKIVGAQEWERKLEVLGSSGDFFDLAVLFLQLSLVVGAIALVLGQNRLKWTFFWLMVSQGLVGIAYAIRALLLAIQS
jgi:hypothetical protein